MMDPSTTFTDYTVFVLIATILCGILAFPSLVFGVPATLLALGVSAAACRHTRVMCMLKF